MPTPEFIFFNDQAARITSLTRDDTTGFLTLVVMSRGAADRDQLIDLLRQDDLVVRLGNTQGEPMRATEIDIRSSGHGPQAIHRIQAVLMPRDRDLTPAARSASSIEDRLTSIEDRLDRIIELLAQQGNRS